MKNINISAVILAGGKNERFYGYNKAFALWRGRRIIELQLEILGDIFSEILIITNDADDFSEFDTIKKVNDIVKDCGPLGGIYTGLKTISNECAFFLGCDMPLIRKDVIINQIKLFQTSGSDAVVPRHSNEFLEPLHAIYSKSLIKSVEAALEGGIYSIHHLFNHVKVKYFDIEEWMAEAFYNHNSCAGTALVGKNKPRFVRMKNPRHR